MDVTVLKMRKFVAPEFVLGEGAAELAGRYAGNLGAKKVLLVSDENLLSLGWPQHVRKSIEAKGLKTTLFTKVTPNPRDNEVMAGAEAYARGGCDSIVAVGGGSPMDCAKGIGVVSTNVGHVLDYEGVDNVGKPIPPLVCVPTTAGSSADVSQFAIINDTSRSRKIAIVSKTMVPDVALVDPLPTCTMSAELTAYTGMDALTHALEAFVSNANSPITDIFALEALRRISKSLARAVANPEDREARSCMTLGSLCAGMAFSNAILGAVHAMSHSLCGSTDLPHGLCNAILLDYVVEANFPHAVDRYTRAAKAMGADISGDAEDREKREAVLDVIRRLKQAVGVTDRLSELGVVKTDLKHLAELAVQDPCMHTNPCQMTSDEIEKIYEQAL